MSDVVDDQTSYTTVSHKKSKKPKRFATPSASSSTASASASASASAAAPAQPAAPTDDDLVVSHQGEKVSYLLNHPKLVFIDKTGSQTIGVEPTVWTRIFPILSSDTIFTNKDEAFSVKSLILSLSQICKEVDAKIPVYQKDETTLRRCHMTLTNKKGQKLDLTYWPTGKTLIAGPFKLREVCVRSVAVEVPCDVVFRSLVQSLVESKSGSETE